MAETAILKKQKEEFEKRRKELLAFLKKEKKEMRKIWEKTGEIQKASKERAKKFLAWHKAYIEKHFPKLKKVTKKK